MYVKQIFPKKSKKFLESYLKRTGKKYEPTFLDNVPVYALLDDDFKQVTTTKKTKVYDDEKQEIKIIENTTDVIYSQSEIKMIEKGGQQIIVVNDDYIENLKNQVEKLEKLTKQGVK